MVKARDLKKSSVITLERACWIVEECHVQHAGRRRPVLHVKMRNMKTRHVIDRTFDELEQLEEPEMQARHHQFLYEDKSGFVFMDAENFEEVTVPADLIGDRRWLLKEGGEFTIRFVEGKVAEVVFPPTFVDKVVETAPPSASGHASHVTKEAKLACGLTSLVPLFIKVGDHILLEAETHKYLGRGSGTP
jgi:elongation factor P